MDPPHEIAIATPTHFGLHPNQTYSGWAMYLGFGEAGFGIEFQVKGSDGMAESMLELQVPRVAHH